MNKNKRSKIDTWQETTLAWSKSMLDEEFRVVVGGSFYDGTSITYVVHSEDKELAIAYARHCIDVKRARRMGKSPEARRDMRSSFIVVWRVPRWFRDEMSKPF